MSSVDSNIVWSIPLPTGLQRVEVKKSKHLNQSDEHFVTVASSGSFIDSYKLNLHENGIFITLRNSPIRDNVWKFRVTSFRKRSESSDFALADERGQVIYFSLKNNHYHTARLASSAVSSLCFAETRKQDLIVAYENGSVIIIDYLTKDIVMTILDKSNHSPVRIIRSHPSYPIVMFAHENGTVSLWNISTRENLGTIQLQEQMIDINFEVSGELISIVSEGRGAIWYQTSTLQLIVQFSLPAGERKTRWTGYACAPVPSRSTNEAHSVKNNRYIVFMTGDNGNLYLWTVVIPVSTSPKLKNNKSQVENIQCLFCVVAELPPQVTEVFQIQVIHQNKEDIPKDSNSRQAPSCRLLLASIEGSVMIIDVNNLESLHMIGPFIVVSYNPSSDLHGSASQSSVVNQLSAYNSFRYSSVSSDGINAVIIGMDGAARCIDLAKAIGYGKYCNQILRGRGPRAEYGSSDDMLCSNAMTGNALSPRSALKSSKPQNKSNIESNRLKKEENLTDTIPLFQLSKLVPEDKRINHMKLKSFYEIHEGFPSRYRSMIWRFLLQLPENTEAYQGFVRRGSHKRFEDLYSEYPIKSRKLYDRLHNVCNQLAHWSSICGEMKYLPQIVFPFIIVYESDELSAFETVMTILMHWGYSWCGTFPQPPHQIVQAYNQLLQLHNKQLYHHFTVTLNISSPGICFWHMLSTLYTEILSKDNWFRSMDFLFLNYDKIEYFILFGLALIQSFRVSLLTIDNEEKMYSYLRTQQDIKIKDIINRVLTMYRLTPKKYWIGITLNNNQKDGVLLQTDSDEVIYNINKSIGKSTFPLPIGRYPVYNGYPKSIVDWQIKERDKILALDHEKSVEEQILLLQQILYDSKKLLNDQIKHSELKSKSIQARQSRSELNQSNDVITTETQRLMNLHRTRDELLNQIADTLLLQQQQFEIKDAALINHLNSEDDHRHQDRYEDLQQGNNEALESGSQHKSQDTENIRNASSQSVGNNQSLLNHKSINQSILRDEIGNKNHQSSLNNNHRTLQDTNEENHDSLDQSQSNQRKVRDIGRSSSSTFMSSSTESSLSTIKAKQFALNISDSESESEDLDYEKYLPIDEVLKRASETVMKGSLLRNLDTLRHRHSELD